MNCFSLLKFIKVSSCLLSEAGVYKQSYEMLLYALGRTGVKIVKEWFLLLRPNISNEDNQTTPSNYSSQIDPLSLEAPRSQLMSGKVQELYMKHPLEEQVTCLKP